MNHVRQRKSIVEAQRSALITEWFHTPMNEKGSPSELVSAWNSKIIDYVKRKGLAFYGPEAKFRSLMCEACCAFFAAFQENSDMSGPHRPSPIPLGWTNDAELVWMDYLQTFIFSHAFWQGFFVEYSELKDDEFFSLFKTKYAEIIQQFIIRDVEYCINYELLAYNSDKQLLRWSEWTEQEEEDDGAYDPYYD
jgi:hypothetical protein